MSIITLPKATLELACCHLIAMTDMKTIFASNFFKAFSGFKRFDVTLVEDRHGLEERIKMNSYHVEMMTKAIKILKRKGEDPNIYQFALAEARTLSDAERTKIAIGSPFFEEIVPEEIRLVIINCMMNE